MNGEGSGEGDFSDHYINICFCSVSGPMEFFFCDFFDVLILRASLSNVLFIIFDTFFLGRFFLWGGGGGANAQPPSISSHCQRFRT